MPVKFGTSGLRGLVTEMPEEVISHYTNAFLKACSIGETLCVARDLRSSSDRIAQNVISTALASGLHVLECGPLPTPALALFAKVKHAGAIMVTGSHIPADRNGLKFYTPHGEITKEDEIAISAHLSGSAPDTQANLKALDSFGEAQRMFKDRYVEAFGADALTGQRIGLYAHSAVGRDILHDILSELGAVVVDLGRSDDFIAVDTEAVHRSTQTQIKTWVQEHHLDALVSTDGDSDRPLLADESGALIPGDILGQITAQALQAQTVVTPISSNSGVLQKSFATVLRTKIGSPYVISAMLEHPDNVVGYEANGGFILGFTARGPAGPIPPLLTRDCVLPLVTCLYAARNESLGTLVSREPPVFTCADRLENIPQDRSQAFIQRLVESQAQRAAFLDTLGRTEKTLDLTDGLRLALDDGIILHLRPSGNAPELRVYVEAQDIATAESLLSSVQALLRREITT